MKELVFRGEDYKGYPVDVFTDTRTTAELLDEVKRRGYVDPDFEEMFFKLQQFENTDTNNPTVRVPEGIVFKNQPLDMPDILARLEEASQGQLTACPNPCRNALLEAISYMNNPNKSGYNFTWSAHKPVEIGRYRGPQVAEVFCYGGDVDVMGYLAFPGFRFGPHALLRFGFVSNSKTL